MFKYPDSGLSDLIEIWPFVSVLRRLGLRNQKTLIRCLPAALSVNVARLNNLQIEATDT